MCKVTMEFKKSTKNTIVFEEVLDGELDSPVIGTLYVPKSTLKAMEWEEGKQISVDLHVEGKEKKTATKAAKTRKSSSGKAVKK